MPWGTFRRAHWQAIAAADFFTVEAWTLRGLARFHVLFVIDLETRRVRIAGITDSPTDEWVTRITVPEDHAVNIRGPAGSAKSGPIVDELLLGIAVNCPGRVVARLVGRHEHRGEGITARQKTIEKRKKRRPRVMAPRPL